MNKMEKNENILSVELSEREALCILALISRCHYSERDLTDLFNNLIKMYPQWSMASAFVSYVDSDGLIKFNQDKINEYLRKE